MVTNMSEEEEFLSIEEQSTFKKDLDKYLKAYPYLREPVAYDMLKQALFSKIRVHRLTLEVLKGGLEPEDMLSKQRLLDALQRTMLLIFTRLGITFTSRQRRKEPTRVKLPTMDEKE